MYIIFMKKVLALKMVAIACAVFMAIGFAHAANVEEIDAPSAAMNKSIPAIVILPDSYEKSADARYPVLYLLHGFGGNHQMWIRIKPDLQRIASLYNMIIVCPDGATSWYWDSPKNPEIRYQTYVADELVKLIDSKYRSIPSREGRAITGLSMGGHGGLWLGINRPDVFGACGSMSGGVDIRPFPYNWNMAKNLGPYAENKDIWDTHTVMNIINKISATPIKIIIDCGTADIFHDVNAKLHEKLLYYNIPHDYISRPGAHNAQYWNNSIDYQALFFAKFFAQARRK